LSAHRRRETGNKRTGLSAVTADSIRGKKKKERRTYSLLHCKIAPSIKTVGSERVERACATEGKGKAGKCWVLG